MLCSPIFRKIPHRIKLSDFSPKSPEMEAGRKGLVAFTGRGENEEGG